MLTRKQQETESEARNSEEMPLTVLATQIIAAIVLFLATLTIGTLPSLIGSIAKAKQRDRANGRRRATITGDSIATTSETRDDAQTRPRVTFQTSMSFLMNFGGGVLFATCFVHMLPEVRESFEAIWPSKPPQVRHAITQPLVIHEYWPIRFEACIH